MNIDSQLTEYPNVVRIVALAEEIVEDLEHYYYPVKKDRMLDRTKKRLKEMISKLDDEIREIEEKENAEYLDVDDPNIEWGSNTDDSMEGYIE